MLAATPGERRFPRVGLAADNAIPVQVWSRQLTTVTGSVTVLGAGGAFVEISKHVPVGGYIDLRFKVPGLPKEIECGAWCVTTFLAAASASNSPAWRSVSAIWWPTQWHAQYRLRRDPGLLKPDSAQHC